MILPLRSSLIATVAAAAVLLVCSQAHSDEAPVKQYVIDDRLPPAPVKWNLIGAGLGTTLAFYAAAQPFSYAWPDTPGVRELRIPVVGPWMALAQSGCADTDPDCSIAWVAARSVLMVLDGLGQIGGLGIALEGLLVSTSPVDPQSQIRQPTRAPSSPPAPAPSPNTTQPTDSPRNLFYLPRPIVIGQRGLGLGVSGMF